MRRAMPAALLAVGMLCASAVSAAAHGGPLVLAGDAGPYRVEAYRFFRTTAGEDFMPYRIHLRSRSTGAQIRGASVKVTVARDQEVIGPVEAVLADEDYEIALVPIMEGGWTVTIDISGELGAGAITHPLPAPASFTEFASMYGVPMVLLVTIWMIRRRLRAPRSAHTGLGTEHRSC